ncbi:MAG: ACT domain-containing protein, partial [Bacteroidota bacterium]
VRIISLRMKLNIRKLSIESHEGMFEGLFQIYLQNTQQLNKLIKMMEALPNIYTVSRYDGDHEGPGLINKD